MRYTILEKFGAFSKIELMNEFNLITLFDNFRILKQNPLYSKLLEEYIFDEQGICQELISDISCLSINEDALISKNNNSLYFMMTDDYSNNVMATVDNKKQWLAFVSDYKDMLIEKENSKQK